MPINTHIPSAQGQPSPPELEGDKKQHTALPQRLESLLKKEKATLDTKKKNASESHATQKQSDSLPHTSTVIPYTKKPIRLKSSWEKITQNEKIRKHHTPHRVLHFVLSTAIFCGTFFVGIIFSGAANKEKSQLPIITSVFQEASAQDIFQADSTALKTDHIVQDHEIISTGPDSQTTLHIPQYGEVRMAANTRIQFLPYTDTPSLTLLEGTIWVMAMKEIAVETEQYHFSLRNGAGSFRKNSDIVQVQSAQNIIPVTLLSEEKKSSYFTLPILSRGTFGEKTILHQEIVQQLRFSKLRKEFHIARAPQNEWTIQNLRVDQVLREKMAREMFPAQKMHSLPALQKAAMYLTFFPKKQQSRMRDQFQQKKQDIIFALKENNFEQAQKIFARSEFTLPQLQGLLEDVVYVQDIVHAALFRFDLEDTILAMLPKQDFAPFRNQILENSFQALYIGFEKSDEQWRDTEIQRLHSFWKQHISSHTNNEDIFFTALARENVFFLLSTFPQEGNLKILAFLEQLNATEIALAAQNEKETIELEIAQKNLALVSQFLEHEQFALAKRVIELSSVGFEQHQNERIAKVREKIIAQKDGVLDRLAFMQQHRTFDEASFLAWKEEQKTLANLRENLRSSAPEEDSLELSEEEIFAQVSTLLLAEGIQLQSGHIIENGVFAIESAMSNANIAFSAKFFPQRRYYQDIFLFPNNTPVAKIASFSDLNNLVLAAHSSTLPPEKVTENEVTVEPAITPTIDPVVADLLARETQKVLINAGLITYLHDIIPQSTSQVKVKKALVEVDSALIEVRFLYSVHTKEISDLLFVKRDITLTNIPLEQASEKISAQELQAQEDDKKITKALSLLARYGLYLDQKNVHFLAAQNTLSFEQLQDTKNNIILEGVFSLPSERFAQLRDREGLLGTWKNISPQEYVEKVATITAPAE